MPDLALVLTKSWTASIASHACHRDPRRLHVQTIPDRRPSGGVGIWHHWTLSRASPTIAGRVIITPDHPTIWSRGTVAQTSLGWVPFKGFVHPSVLAPPRNRQPSSPLRSRGTR